MQPKPALLLVACGAVVGALTVAPVRTQAAGSPPGSFCDAPTGFVVNRWIGEHGPGDVGRWNNAKNWSLGVPRFGSSDQVVCIRTAGRVVLDRTAGLEVHVAAINIGGTSKGYGQLAVLPSNALFVEASPDQLVSTVAPSSRLTIKGAVLGGHGRVEVQGELTLYGAAAPNVLTTRACASICGRPAKGHGTLAVEGGGVLRVNHGPTTVTDSYHVVLGGGEMVIQRDGGQVTADGGTRLAIRQSSRGASEPVLTFHNDGGWYANPLSAALTRVRFHGGVVLKDKGDGTSSIDGDVRTTAPVKADIRTGELAIAGLDSKAVTSVVSGGSSYSTGGCDGITVYDCSAAATSEDRQIVTVALPAAADTLELQVTLDAQPQAGIGRAATIVGDQPDVTRRHPVRLFLRYDASIVNGRTPASTAVAMARKGTFRDLRPCLSNGTIPAARSACVDPNQSRLAPDSDLVMVVRTLHFSRYICR